MPHQKYIGANGKEWPSVTTVLSCIAKPALLWWYAQNGWQACERTKEEASAFGRSVHAGLEAELKGEKRPKLTERESLLVDRGLAWLKENKFVVDEIETHVVHEELGFHGTFDVLGHYKGKTGEKYILDWKSSSKISKENALQLSAYAAAWNFQNKKDWTNGVNGGIIVRMDKKAEKSVQVQPKRFPGLENYFPYFQAALLLTEGGYGR